MSDFIPPKGSLSPILIQLLKGIIHRDENVGLWQELLLLQTALQDYMAVLGLELLLYEDEGFAYLVNKKVEEGEESLPRLISRRPLSYPVSLLLALLKKRLAEQDAHSDERLILNKQEIIDMMAVYFPRNSNEVQFHKKVESWIQRVNDLGFIRYLGDQKERIEVLRILSVFIDAQWLKEFDLKMKEYRDYALKHHGSDDSAGVEE